MARLILGHSGHPQPMKLMAALRNFQKISSIVTMPKYLDISAYIFMRGNMVQCPRNLRIPFRNVI